MKKLLAIGALAFAMPAQAAVTISYVGGTSGPTAGTTIFQNFNSFAPGAAIGTNAFAYNTTTGNGAIPAFNSTGNYGSVLSNGNYSVTFATAASIFSFVLGSLDSYNRLTLTMSSGGPLVYNGSAINNGPIADGSQVGSGTNGRVTYTVTGGGPFILGATFESIGANSFEFDDLAIQAVPEPTTWLMMLMGFAAIGFGMRRRNTAGAPAVA